MNCLYRIDEEKGKVYAYSFDRNEDKILEFKKNELEKIKNGFGHYTLKDTFRSIRDSYLYDMKITDDDSEIDNYLKNDSTYGITYRYDLSNELIPLIYDRNTFRRVESIILSNRNLTLYQSFITDLNNYYNFKINTNHLEELKDLFTISDEPIYEVDMKMIELLGHDRIISASGFDNYKIAETEKVYKKLRK